MGSVRSIPQPSQKDIEKFWSKVDQSGGPDACWPWLRGKGGVGYGNCYIGRQSFGSHRVAYFIATGTDPGDKMACHTCDNKPCCNPDHLFLGTALDNVQDMDRKGRRRNPGRQGEAHHKAILRQDQVNEIRQRYAAGDITQLALAKEYGVSKPTIGQIARGTLWTDGKPVPIVRIAKGKSGYRGVNRRPTKTRPWVATIKRDGKQRVIGCFDDPVDAARAYDREAAKVFGCNARLNFPNDAEGDANDDAA